MLLGLLLATAALAEPTMKFQAVLESNVCDAVRSCKLVQQAFEVKLPLVKFSPEWTVAVWEPELDGAHFQLSFTREPPEPLHNILQLTGGRGEDPMHDVTTQVSFSAENFPESLSLWLPYEENADGSGRDFELTVSGFSLSH